MARVTPAAGRLDLWGWGVGVVLSWAVVGTCLQLCMSLYPGRICFIYFLHWLARVVSLVFVKMIASGVSLVSNWPSAGREVDTPKRPLTFQVMMRKEGAGVVCVWEGVVGVGGGAAAGVVCGLLVSVLLMCARLSCFDAPVGRKVWRRVCFFLAN